MRMPPHLRIAFRVHTGWATMVGVAAGSGLPQVLVRARVEFLPARHERFVFHKAVEMELDEAARLIDETRALAEETARRTIRETIGAFRVTSASVIKGTATATEDLAAVLRSHARIHSAEGALYAGAIGAACESLGIRVRVIGAKDAWAAVTPEVSEAIAALGKTLGPPWRLDHKLATAAAMSG